MRTRAAFAAALAAALLGGSAAASSPAPRRVGAAPRVPAGGHVVGALASSTRLTVAVVLQPRDPAGLQDYATAVSTPGSSVYHHFLTVAEFRARFGPTDAQIAAVQSSLRAHGLSPGAVTANGLSIPVTDTAAAIGHAFSTTLERVTLPSGRSAFVNSQAPLIDPSVAGVVRNVVGLDNLAVPRPLALRSHSAVTHSARPAVATGGPQPCSAATSAATANGSYTADQIASAYGFSGLYGAGDFGGGQTVAIYELEGNFQSDITTYEACYGIAAPVAYKHVDGGPPAPVRGQDGFETELDIENVVGAAPQANVLVYQGPNSNSGLPGAGPYDTYNQIVSDNAARVVSTSWVICEPADAPVPTAQQDENTLFQEAATQGQSIFAAAGDSGSQGCVDMFGDAVPGIAADDPASQPFVTGTGGTRLSSLGPAPTESVWNDSVASAVCADSLSLPSACGTGGGISDLWPMPSYQSGAPAGLNVINANSSGGPCAAQGGSFCREVPDVSGDADPATGYTIYYGGWGAIGGTSAVAPLWAGLMAEVNAFSACHGTPIGFANPALYATAGHVYAGHFNDITVGNNDILGTNGGLYPAGAGYDMATGLGSPNATALAQNLCAPAIGVTNPGAQTTRVHKAASVQISANDSAGNALSYSATGLPPGLSINGTTGAISGSPSTPGLYTVTVRAADARGSSGTATFTWTVEGRPVESHGSLTGVRRGQPRLTFTLAAGKSAPKLKKIVVALPHGLSFSHGGRDLKRGIRPRGASFKVRGGKLTITLKSGVTKTKVTISPPALRETRALRRAHKKLKFTLQAIDTSGFATTIKLKLRPS
jgi:subtilase family serine protease